MLYLALEHTTNPWDLLVLDLVTDLRRERSLELESADIIEKFEIFKGVSTLGCHKE